MDRRTDEGPGRSHPLCLAVGLLGACLACGHDWSAASDDGGESAPDTGDGDAAPDTDTGADADAEVDAAPDDGAPPDDDVGPDGDAGADADADDATTSDDAGSPDADADVDVSAPVCGNGVVEPSEVCDDGNAVTEGCSHGTERACLSDCSLRIADCGNGAVDPGEACDDGNADSFDTCTTSCTVNTRSFGAPCRCTSGCSDFDFSAGTIVGCESVPPPSGATGRVTCYRAMDPLLFTWELYGAEGYCTLMAVECEGSPMFCSMVPQFGSVELLECPAPYLKQMRMVDYSSTIVVTMAYCAQPCTSPRECRWNSVEGDDSPWAGECGQWTCLREAGASEGFCEDPRNLID